MRPIIFFLLCGAGIFLQMSVAPVVAVGGAEMLYSMVLLLPFWWRLPFASRVGYALAAGIVFDLVFLHTATYFFLFVGASMGIEAVQFFFAYFKTYLVECVSGTVLLGVAMALVAIVPAVMRHAVPPILFFVGIGVWTLVTFFVYTGVVFLFRERRSML